MILSSNILFTMHIQKRQRARLRENLFVLRIMVQDCTSLEQKPYKEKGKKYKNNKYR